MISSSQWRWWVSNDSLVVLRVLVDLPFTLVIKLVLHLLEIVDLVAQVS